MAEIEVGLVAEEDARPPVLCPVQILVGEGEAALQVEFGQIMLRLLHAPEQTDLIEAATDGVRRDGQLQLSPDVLGRDGWLLV